MARSHGLSADERRQLPMSIVEMRTLSLAMDSSEKDQNRVQWSYLRYAGTGIEFFSTIAVLTLLGTFLDGRFGTSPVLTIVLAFLGFAAATWNLIRSVSRTSEPQHHSGDQP